jgi:hypothetical protein
MGLTEAIIVVVCLSVAILALLGYTMSRGGLLRRHRPRGGRPAARPRWRHDHDDGTGGV